MCAALVRAHSNSTFTDEELAICNSCIPRNLSNGSKHSFLGKSSSFNDLSEISKHLKECRRLSESLKDFNDLYPYTSQLSSTNYIPSRRGSISSLHDTFSSNYEDDEPPSFQVKNQKNIFDHELNLEILTPTLASIIKHPKSNLKLSMNKNEKNDRNEMILNHHENNQSGNKSVKFSENIKQVKHFISTDGEPPKIPTAVLSRLNLQTDKKFFALRGLKYFSANFVNPITRNDFSLRLNQQQVCLENAMIERSLLMGTVAVINRCFEKSVIIRCSFNEWATFMDFTASYIHDSSVGNMDRFCFSIVLPVNLVVGDHVQFAIKYSAGILGEDGVFWDNNCNRNYVFECFAKTAAIQGDDFWMHFL